MNHDNHDQDDLQRLDHRIDLLAANAGDARRTAASSKPADYIRRAGEVWDIRARSLAPREDRTEEVYGPRPADLPGSCALLETELSLFLQGAERTLGILESTLDRTILEWMQLLEDTASAVVATAALHLLDAIEAPIEALAEQGRATDSQVHATRLRRKAKALLEYRRREAQAAREAAGEAADSDDLPVN